MTLTPKDAGAAAVAVLVTLVYVANTQGWWYLGSNRWAIGTSLAVGSVGCSLGRMEKPTRGTVLLALLGVATLVVAVVGLVTGARSLLLALTVVQLALWAGATVRHLAGSPPHPAAGS